MRRMKRIKRTRASSPVTVGAPGALGALVTLGALLASPTPALAQSDDHAGWVDVISITPILTKPGGGATASTTGKARLAEPPANTRRPARLALLVPRGPVQQALARAHRDRTAFDLTTGGKSAQGTYLKWELKNAQVVNYQVNSADNGARVVIRAGLAAPPPSDDG